MGVNFNWPPSAAGGSATPSLATLSLLGGGFTGASVYVADQGEYYELDTANTFAASSPLIIAATGGGNWFRRSKAYVVGNFFLWICNTSGFFAGDALIGGFSPGQQAAGAIAPDILLNLGALATLAGPFINDVVQDTLGNLWVTGYHHAAGTTSWAWKFALSDVLASGSPTPRVTLTQALNSPANTGAQVTLFDRNNAMWQMVFSLAGTIGVTLNKYGAPSYAQSGSPTADITVQGTNVILNEYQDGLFDPQGNFWASCWSGGAKGIVMFTAAQLATSATGVVPTVVWTGTNFTGPIGMAFYGGLLWVANYGAGGAASRLRAFAYIGATSGNPAPLIDIAVTGANGLAAIAFAPDGSGAWVVAQDDAKTVFLTTAQLAASGTVAAGRALVVRAGDFPECARFALNPSRSGLGPSGVPIIP